ncbi:MAG: AvaI/BsoBI family type II restriction endonuclease [Thiofilum sp.]|uniref:AvaI/BsoBI family type II restriction endonuclease n=1 Tax=Thiofilum sp. TaxID=2212733 RepID=UPI0025D68309|nr:AvaI/BsoBI family type II restriction endonuclease [Thiofilum sp.]MBK8452354.1 hypothetical protein [Thiofilum sp.]
MTNIYIQCAEDLITTREARRNGFLDYALRRSIESEPFIDRAKILKVYLNTHSNKASDLLGLNEIRESLLEAAGLSVKAKAHLSDEDKDNILANFIEKILVPMGAAIESAMAYEIFDLYVSAKLANCANLTNDHQLATLCDWLVKQ